MGFGGSSPSPQPIPPVPPAAQPATLANPLVAQTAAAQRARAAAIAGAGFGGTIGTSPEGLQTPPLTANATLLGGTR
jgi:hypothetical protein